MKFDIGKILLTVISLVMIFLAVLNCIGAFGAYLYFILVPFVLENGFGLEVNLVCIVSFTAFVCGLWFMSVFFLQRSHRVRRTAILFSTALSVLCMIYFSAWGAGVFDRGDPVGILDAPLWNIGGALVFALGLPCIFFSRKGQGQQQGQEGSGRSGLES